jgi:RimJ/RimL family protein N-acetyltransferase
MIKIVTKRFLLRDFVDSDRSPFLDYQADPRNQTFYEPDRSSPDQAARLFEMFQAWAGDRPRLNYQLAIVQRQEPYALVGCLTGRPVAPSVFRFSWVYIFLSRMSLLSSSVLHMMGYKFLTLLDIAYLMHKLA